MNEAVSHLNIIMDILHSATQSACNDNKPCDIRNKKGTNGALYVRKHFIHVLDMLVDADSSTLVLHQRKQKKTTVIFPVA